MSEYSLSRMAGIMAEEAKTLRMLIENIQYGEVTQDELIEKLTSHAEEFDYAAERFREAS